MPKPHPDNKFCLPIIRDDPAEVARIIRNNALKQRYFEIWLDYLDELSTEWLASLISKYPNRLLLVFRRLNLEPMKLAPEERLEIIKTLQKKAVLFDIDVTVQTEDIAALKRERLRPKTVFSYHNYSFTPSDSELKSIIKKMISGNAYIVKIAAFCKTERDSLRLLSLLMDLRDASQRCIVLGMGPHSSITRIFGTLWGNEMAFTPSDSQDSTAPGQLTFDELRSVLGVIRK